MAPHLENDISGMGIYGIFNLYTGKAYIGSASGAGGFRERWKGHLKSLNKHKHHSVHLQRAWDKYGRESFLFIIIERVESGAGDVYPLEQSYLDLYKPYLRTNGYNINRNAVGFSAETITPFVKAYWASMTKEERLVRQSAVIAGHKAWRNSMTPKESKDFQDARIPNMRKGNSEYWNSMTIDERRIYLTPRLEAATEALQAAGYPNHKAARMKFWEEASQEQRDEMGDRFRHWWKNAPPEQIEQRNKRVSDAKFKYWASKTPEEIRNSTAPGISAAMALNHRKSLDNFERLLKEMRSIMPIEGIFSMALVELLRVQLKISPSMSRRLLTLARDNGVIHKVGNRRGRYYLSSSPITLV